MRVMEGTATMGVMLCVCARRSLFGNALVAARVRSDALVDSPLLAHVCVAANRAALHTPGTGGITTPHGGARRNLGGNELGCDVCEGMVGAASCFDPAYVARGWGGYSGQSCSFCA